MSCCKLFQISKINCQSNTISDSSDRIIILSSTMNQKHWKILQTIKNMTAWINLASSRRLSKFEDFN